MGRIIDLVKPLGPFLPEVEAPKKSYRVPLTEKLFWTAAALLVYLVASQIPLYGIRANSSSEAFFMLRQMLASNSRTLMELGITPIITSGMIMQLLAGAKIIEVDLSKREDQELFSTASKLLGVFITIGEALAYVLAGNYGPVSQIGTGTAMLLVAQLFMSGIIVLMLDDLLSKGWGLGSGINLFIVTNICENIMWGALSPMTYNMNGGTQMEGALVATIHLLFTEKNPLRGLYKACFRPDLPNLLNLSATVAVILVVCYIQGWKVDVPIKPPQRGAPSRPYPIKLFYTSNMPIILMSALVGNLYFFSQVLHRRYPDNLLVKMLGVWQDTPGGRSAPVWGLSYVLMPPRELSQLVESPVRSLVYIVFMLTTCAMFAKMWVEISGSSAKDVGNQLAKQGINVRGQGLQKKLDKVIPTAAAFGGMCVAALSIFADLLGAIGSGTGILMAVTTIYGMAEKVDEAQKLEQQQKNV